MDALKRFVVLLLCPALVVAAVVFAAVTTPIVEKGEWVVTGQETVTDSIINAANVTIESGGT